MIFRKLQVFCMTACLVSGAQVFAKKGTETGGGGDAIKDGHSLVLRDFMSVEYDKLEKVDSKVILDTQGFKDILIEIGQAYPLIAQKIFQDLLNAKMYFYSGELEILAGSATTLGRNDVKAEVQLAIRKENEIVFAKNFQDVLDNEGQPAAQYLVLHEAIHGLLENTGPLHHAKVKAIVKFIKNNRGNLPRNTKGTPLEYLGSPGYHFSIAFSPNVSVPLKCYSLTNLDKNTENPEALAKYLGYECPELSSGYAELFYAKAYAEEKELLNFEQVVEKLSSELKVYSERIGKIEKSKLMFSSCRKIKESLVFLEEVLQIIPEKLKVLDTYYSKIPSNIPSSESRMTIDLLSNENSALTLFYNDVENSSSIDRYRGYVPKALYSAYEQRQSWALNSQVRLTNYYKKFCSY